MACPNTFEQILNFGEFLHTFVKLACLGEKNRDKTLIKNERLNLSRLFFVGKMKSFDETKNFLFRNSQHFRQIRPSFEDQEIESSKLR